MIVEMHCHTTEHSACSHVGAADLVKKAFHVGIQAVVITDHHYQWDDDELCGLRRTSGLPEIFILLSGQEVTTYDFGDVLVYGAAATIPKQKISLAEIRAMNPAAAIVWAHPYRNKKIPRPEQLMNPLLDGVEIFSSNYTILEATRALKDWHTYKFTATAGTDTHAYSYTGSYPTVFDHPVQSITQLAEEIKAGRCRPYFRESPKTGTTRTKISELKIGPGTPEKRNAVIVKTVEDTGSWESGERSFRIVDYLAKQGFDGGPYRVPKPLDKDAYILSFIEEKVEGDTLFDALVKSTPKKAPLYLEMAAKWLSKLHHLRIKLTSDEEFLFLEPERLENYLKIHHKNIERVREIKNVVLEKELDLIENRPEILIQGHGDFHPKNMIVGRDESRKEFVAAIDFDSSYQLPRAFDVGTFLAQYNNMFFDEPGVQTHAPSDIFLAAYLSAVRDLEDDFMSQVSLFKARTYISILYYLLKVGKGDTENFWTILVKAEKSLSATAFR
ncbi:MAG: phosphotransferase [Desulfobacterales bacterium]